MALPDLVENPAELLKRLQTRHLGEELVRLILLKTPKEVIEKRPGRGGFEYDYVPIYWVVNRLNELFGFLWDDFIEECGIINEKGQDGNDYPIHVWVRGGIRVRIPGKTIIERRPDGTVIETRIDTIEITKAAFGGTDVKYFKEGGIIDIGDDFKAAHADVIKKAASFLGICADIYGKREQLEKVGPTEQQLKALYKAGEAIGWDKQKVDDWCVNQFNVPTNELQVGSYMKAIQTLIKIKKGESLTKVTIPVSKK